jgi:hypothetical protein
LPAIYHRVGAILGKLETERSLTLQALRYAVETELADYHRYMATIEKRLDSRRRQMEQPLSLQQLLVYQHQPLERMQFTLRFLEQLAGLLFHYYYYYKSKMIIIYRT